MKKKEYANMEALDGSHWWFLGMTAIMISVLDRFISHKARVRVLDAGCGTCWFSKSLMKYGSVTALDIEPSLEPVCKSRGVERFVVGDAVSMPFEDGMFDLVVCSEVLYHQYVKDDTQVMKEFLRVLKPGGRVLVKVPAHAYLGGAHDEVNLTRHRYEKNEVRNLFINTGFEVEFLSYANCFLFPVIFLKRVLERVLPGELGSDVRSVPVFLNKVLFGVLRCEATILSRMPLPQGSSIICVGRKHA
ncbi:MAG: type 11 methyltransferase [Parcubacteria group bacterium Gr01-1014_70]|nr:MAG: type 11 methyltransferase [Parcubacteria group bacterium Gr01-1014_70]